MAQVSYGTITITDTNDINRIYVEYCRSTSNQLSGTTVPDITVNWSESTPAWVDGQYIWQRTVVEKSGTLAKTYGTPVCLTGAQGETGDQGPQGPQGGTGAAGRSLTSTATQYTIAATSATITQSNMGNYTWSNNVPDYNASTPAYWVRITNTYSNPSSTQYIIYKDNGITDAVKTSHDANTTATAANSTANTANQTANTANSTANSANTKADQAVTNVNNLQNKLKYYWVNEVAHTNGVSGWTKPNYPAGTYAASGISGTTFDVENSSTYGYNTWYANGINLRYNAIKLGELTGSALTFYQPSTTTQGAKAMELSGTALKFYNSAGTTVQAEFGGSRAKISGIINAYEGYIGNIANIDALTDSDNYWYIGHYKDYTQTESAAIKSSGSAFIQLGKENTWRLATNRIHTAWNNDGGVGDAFRLHFPRSSDNRYWDYGLHFPTISSNLNDKFIYIRNSSTTQTLENLNDDLDDNTGFNYWQYRFYVTADGNLYARNLYVLDDNGQATQIGGTDGVYLLKSGGTITGDLTVNGTLTGTLSGTATRVSKDLKIQLNGGTTEGTNQFTYNGSAAKTINITKSSVGLSNVENTALSTWAGSSNLTTTKVGTLAAAAVKGVDTSLTTSTISTNLPTSAAVVNLIKQYLPLTGGNVTGAVTFGSSVSADELTVGDLVVNGAASFTNNLQANTINGVAVGSNPKFTDTVTTVTVTGSGNAITSMTASHGAITATKGSTFLTSYTETDPIFVASAAHGITSSDISNWNSKTSNTGTVTSVTASGSDGISISGSPITTSGTITIGLNLSTAINRLGEGALPATREDYIVAQYAGGGTTTTTYHRRKLSNIFAALNKSDITTALGYTPPTQDTNTHYTTHLYVNNNTTTNQNTTTALTNGNVYLHLYDDSTKRDSHKISGSGTVSVTSDTSGNIVITGSAHPTSLKNPNALLVKVYNGTSSSTNTSYDGSTANQSVNVAGTNAITGINSTTDGKLQLTLADGSQPEPISVKITATTSDSAASADKLNLSANVGSLTQPVYFDANTGLPVATTYSLNKTVPSDAKFTDTWIAMVGATSSANGTAGYVDAPPKDGYNTKFLRADGTWVVPGGTYSLPLAANGTRGGVQIGYTANGKNYPVQLSSEKMYVNVPWENTWRGIQNNLTSDSTTDSLSAAQGKALANGSARDNTKLPLSGGTMTGQIKTDAGSGSWLSAATNAALYSTVTSGYNAITSQATKNGRITISTYPTSDDKWYLTYFLNTRTENGNDGQLSWTPSTNTLSTNISGNAATATTASWANLLKPIATTTTASASTWNIPSGSKQVWGESFKDSTLTYTPSGGSATTITDSGDWTMWLTPSATTNTATLNMRIDGTYYGSFSGNLSGNASTATAANRLAQNSEMTYAWNGINYFNISAANQSAAKVNDTPYTNTTWTHILRFNHANTTGYYTDLAVPFNANGIYYKRINGGALQNSSTNGGWVSVLDQLNYTNYTVTKTGSGASGTWGISITGTAAKATADASGNTITSTYVKKAGDTMTGALNTANGTANKIGDDSQLGDFNVGGTLGIQGLNSTTGVALLQKGTTWGSTGNYAHITYDGTYVNINKLFKVSASGNTVTIGSQNASFTHIYNSLSIPFIFNNSVLTTSGSLGNNTYPFTNVNISGAYNMIVSGAQKAAMHYDSTLEAIVFSFA